MSFMMRLLFLSNILVCGQTEEGQMVMQPPYNRFSSFSSLTSGQCSEEPFLLPLYMFRSKALYVATIRAWAVCFSPDITVTEHK